jgi:hypothetical protein
VKKVVVGEIIEKKTDRRIIIQILPEEEEVNIFVWRYRGSGIRFTYESLPYVIRFLNEAKIKIDRKEV